MTPCRREVTPRKSYQKRHQAMNHLVRLGVTQALTRLGVTLAQKKCPRHHLPHKVDPNNVPEVHQESRRSSMQRLGMKFHSTTTMTSLIELR